MVRLKEVGLMSEYKLVPRVVVAVNHICDDTVSDSDLDSVILKAYKVKDCGRNLGSDNCI